MRRKRSEFQGVDLIPRERTKSYRRFVRAVVALVLFGTAFGYVEAAVVVYLRVSYEPLHQRLHPDRAANDLFPIIRLDQLDTAGPEYGERLLVEIGREAATIIMLAAIALAVARNAREWLAAFMLAFGIWDILFYVFLRIQIGWPTSFLEWDLLFLLPVPWVGPVLAPLIVAISMTVAGVAILWRESIGTPMRLAVCHWAAIFSGAILIVLAFCWDCGNIMKGGLPNPFNWPLFLTGELLGVVSFLHGLPIRQGVPVFHEREILKTRSVSSTTAIDDRTTNLRYG
jgi:hypothetical protein